MPAKIMDGTNETQVVLTEVAQGIAALAEKGVKPCLAALLATDDAGAVWYAKAQAKHCLAHGVEHKLIRLPADASQADMVAAVKTASADPAISGLIILTPLPAGVDQLALAEAIAPEKDAEGVHPTNLGRLMVANHSDPAPCTAMAVMELIKSAKPDLAGSRALVIGRSATVGKPIGLMLLAQHATVTIGHTRSDLRPILLDAEVVVAAAGACGAKWRAYERKWQAWRDGKGERPAEPNLEPLVTMDMVRRGAVVVDVGDSSVPEAIGADGGPVLDDKGRPKMRYAGDVDFEKVSEMAGFITKPRGSVGPLTNAFLLRNVVRSALRQHGI